MKNRRKHVPLRTCIACRQKRPKRELIRIVRSPEGDVAVDPRGKSSGRGAYLCASEACWQIALDQGRLARALRCPVSKEQVEALKKVAAATLERQAADEIGLVQAQDGPK